MPLSNHYSPGPKLYIATAGDEEQGTTKLHLDVTSAVNILMYEHHCGNPGADWTIFCRDQLDELRKYLKKHKSYKQIKGDRIHSQEVCLDEDDFKALAEQGVIPLQFTQHCGEAVFINVGCAHQVGPVLCYATYTDSGQVRNLGACIKVTVDFLDTAALLTTFQIAEELRKILLPNVLLHKHVLWHAWHSFHAMLQTGHGIQLHTRQQRINLRRRKHEKEQNRHAKHTRNVYLKEGLAPEEYDAHFAFRCPDIACATIDRPFSENGVFGHM